MSRFRSHVFILMGPSGVGKTTIGHALMRRFKRLRRVITYTTRAPRPGEVNHRDYHFVDVATFEKKRAQGDFIEYARVHGDLYASAWEDLSAVRSQGHSVLFIVDVQGARNIKRKIKGAISIFLAPDNLDALRARIARRRSSEGRDQIERRMKTAQLEMKQMGTADHVVVNRQGKRGEAIRELAGLIKSYFTGERP